MTIDPLIRIRDLSKAFESKKSLSDTLFRREPDRLTALDGVSIDVQRGEALGIVGESGCGKSTLARCLVGIYEPSDGEIWYDGHRLGAERSMGDRQRMQIVFQDPYSSLNARMRVGQAIAEVLSVHKIVPSLQVEARVTKLLDLVGLSADIASVYPRQLSGGQRQRVSIARALAVEPDVLVADEPVSALDVSVQATVLNLLSDLRDRLGLTLVMIAHDLSVVRHLCDRVAVMYLGRVVETGPTERLFADPRHPYTRALMAAVPTLEVRRTEDTPAVAGDPPSPYALPPGCRFHTRCPVAAPICQAEDPALSAGEDGTDHLAACHFAWSSE